MCVGWGGGGGGLWIDELNNLKKAATRVQQPNEASHQFYIKQSEHDLS